MEKYISLKDKNLLRIGIGTSGFGGYFSSRTTSQEDKKNFINFFCQVYDYGIRFVDTAESYASGETEKLIGCLPKNIRYNLFIASKFNLHNSNLKNIEQSLDKTLLKLKRDYVDLYMPHWPLPDMNSEELIQTLNNLKKKGKIKYIGLSNFENCFKDFENYTDVKFYESELNPYYTNAHKILSSHLNEHQTFLVGYAPFKQGIIFNKVSKVNTYFLNKYGDLSLTLAQFVLIWMLSLSDKIIVIPKTQNIKRLKEFVDIFNLNKDMIKNIKKNINSLRFDKVENISVKKIIMKKDGDRPVYFNLKDALENKYLLHPNVLDIANEIKKNNGNITKPVRLLKDDKSKKYFCLDGRLKYWAWVYLHGNDCKIPSVVY